MAGKTLTTLKRNCLGLLTSIVGADNFTYSVSQKKAVLFGHNVWLEGAADERAENKIRGMTLKGCYIDELSLIPKAFYLMALSRLSTRGAALIATTNPDSPTSYTYTDIIKNKRLDKRVVKFVLDDNIFLDNAYKKSIKREYSGVFYERFILGNFCAAQGAVYRIFSENKAAFFTSEPMYDYIQAGVDFGGNGSAHSFTAVGLCRDNSRLTALISRRVEAKGTTPEDLYREFGEFIRAVKEKYGEVSCVYADSAEQVLIRGLKGRYRSVIIKNAVKGAVIGRIRATVTLMSQGRFYYTKDCEPLCKALETALFDSKKQNDTRLDNNTTDIDSLDSFEYAWERQAKALILGKKEL